MVYTVIYKEEDKLKTFVFASQSDKNQAWYDFINNYAEPGQDPIALCPGNAVVYFENCISPEKS